MVGRHGRHGRHAWVAPHSLHGWACTAHLPSFFSPLFSFTPTHSLSSADYA
jgi:hypothetical protein